MSHRLHPAAVARTTDEARRGRSERDSAAINDPERARRATAALLAGDFPERDRVIHEGFARTYEAYNRRDWEVNTLFQAPDLVFRVGDMRELAPDLREEYHGVEGYLEAVHHFLEVWPDAQNEVLDILAADEDRVVVLLHWAGHAGRSGIPFDQPSIHEIGFRDGLVVSQVYWMNVKLAARELGVQPPPSRR